MKNAYYLGVDWQDKEEFHRLYKHMTGLFPSFAHSQPYCLLEEDEVLILKLALPSLYVAPHKFT